MIARSVALCVALSLASGCGTHQSTYVRQAASPGELVWRYDDRLQVTRNGQVVAEGGAWHGLDTAVRCVPLARDRATAATARHRKGSTTLWIGVIGAIVGVTVGTVLFASDPDDADRAVPGLFTIAGSLLFGAVTVPIGGYLRASANARGIDAINLYNDKLAGGACTPAPAPKPDP